jgi:hypothetical protein
MELDREWEKYTGGPFVAYHDRVHVTLSERGKLLLNRNTYRLLGNPKRVLLYFNRAKDTIGVRPAHERLAEAFPVRELGESFVVYIGTFCRHYGIRLTTTERFTHPELTAEGLLTLNLSNTVTVSRGPRKRN